jgi:hypothetical protein
MTIGSSVRCSEPRACNRETLDLLDGRMMFLGFCGNSPTLPDT